MGNVNMESDQIHYRNNSKPSLHKVGAALDALFASDASINQDIIDITAAMTAKADKIDIAPAFSAETAYFEGDMVFQSGRLWKFTTNHDPGEWNQEEVTATNIDIAIKEAGGGGSSAGNEYSTTEQEIGKWIDGKTLYQKTYALRVNSVDQYTVTQGNQYNIGDNFEHAFLKHAEGYRLNDNYIDVMSNPNEYLIVISRNGVVYCPYSTRYSDVYVTICYTKPATP